MAKLESILDRKIIQGGMGVGVSCHGLASMVSQYGQLGVISATAPDLLLTRGLQQGDASGKLREALSHFPNQDIASQIVDKYFIDGGKEPNVRFRFQGTPTIESISETDVRLADANVENLLVAGAFVEVYLAKKGHANPIGANFLSKIEWAQLPTLYGAMLAGVDVVLIGAGFPKEIPDILSAFEVGNAGRMSMPITSETKRDRNIYFNPARFGAEQISRPIFLGIVGNHLGAKALPAADGYIFEGPIAGGHNPPARVKELTSAGEPAYGPKDDMNFALLATQLLRNNEQKEEMDPQLRAAQIRRNGRLQPYWLAGNYATRLNEALANGAQGVQVGTPFSTSHESGIVPYLKQREIAQIMAGATAFTDPRASPTGFPFKTLLVSDTIGMKEVYESRTRICDLKYLVNYVEQADGKIISRCPSEPINDYLRKGGLLEETVGRKCLCNGLSVTIGLGTPGEKPLITSGGNFDAVKALVAKHGPVYSARDVIDYILSV